MKIEDMRIAFISPWRDKSGVSTYAEALIPLIARRCREAIILAERLPEAAMESGVIRCWTRGDDLSQLIHALQAFKPDAVYIEHQYNLFPDPWEWLTLTAEISACPHVVKMHSVYGERTRLMGALEPAGYLGCLDKIVVHTTQAEHALKTKRQLSNVHTIAHGCPETMPPVGNDKPIIFSFGFGFKYKGLEMALKVLKNLHPKYPDLLYIGVFSEEPRNTPAYNHYYDEMRKLIAKEGMEEHFILLRGYKEELFLKNFARTCSVALFPYTENGNLSVYGSSGTARLAMSWGLPVVTSNTPLFFDLEGIVEKGISEEDMTAKVEKLLFIDSKREAQLEKQKEFAETNSWENVAEQHIQLLIS